MTTDVFATRLNHHQPVFLSPFSGSSGKRVRHTDNGMDTLLHLLFCVHCNVSSLTEVLGNIEGVSLAQHPTLCNFVTCLSNSWPRARPQVLLEYYHCGGMSVILIRSFGVAPMFWSHVSYHNAGIFTGTNFWQMPVWASDMFPITLLIRNSVQFAASNNMFSLLVMSRMVTDPLESSIWSDHPPSTQ